MKTGKLIPLSVQEMLDCCPFIGKRDWTTSLLAFDCMGGIESEKTYPYRGGKCGGWIPGKLDQCRFDKSRSVAYLVSADSWEIYGEASAAKALIESGPLANHMNAAARSFQFYSEGKYQNFQSLSHYD